ncbi:serine protease [Elizabethkingia anophelis]|nr:serine protease [Elizabethkingia anophelis]MDV3528189.1 serine protease [Elizabethkingia anophelis]
MLEFLNGLQPLEKGFWYVALISSVIFAIQSIMTFVGGHDADGINADFSGDLDHVDSPFQFFSFRNLINFMLGFGWTGVVFYNTIGNRFLLIALATLIGCLFVYLFFLMIQQIMKLSEDNTFNIENLVNASGQVYIPIPENMNGKGKVQISVKGAHHELDAMTEGGDRLASGTSVIVEKIKDKILIVKKLN